MSKAWIWCLTCVGLIALLGCAPESDINDEAGLPFDARDRLEIARNARGKPASQLSLVCTPMREIRLVLLARVPAPREMVRVGAKDNVTLIVNGSGRTLLISATLVRTGKLDVIATRAITEGEAHLLATDYGAAPPHKVSFMGFYETGIYLRGGVTGETIAAYSRKCWSASSRST